MACAVGPDLLCIRLQYILQPRRKEGAAVPAALAVADDACDALVRGMFRSGAFQWFVGLDDDSWIRPGRLLQVLGSLDASKRLYLGDFPGLHRARSYNRRHPRTRLRKGADGANATLACAEEDFWDATWRQFKHINTGGAGPSYWTCGGTGIIFSRATVLAMDHMKCMRRANASCSNVDWMLGACASAYGAEPVQAPSCSVCGQACAWPNGCWDQQAKLGSCAFAHVTGPVRACAAAQSFETLPGTVRRSHMASQSSVRAHTTSRCHARSAHTTSRCHARATEDR